MRPLAPFAVSAFPARMRRVDSPLHPSPERQPMDLSGIFVPVTTPFLAGGEADVGVRLIVELAARLSE